MNRRMAGLAAALILMTRYHIVKDIGIIQSILPIKR